MTTLYEELADWWPLLSSPAEYREEAAYFHGLLQEATTPPPRTVLELGSGGGNNASHLKAHYSLTLVDLSPGMIAVSKRLNPECEHLLGDLRTVRLGRTFDAVFIHDAIMYATTLAELEQAVETAYVHLRPGGVLLVAPDCVRETFSPDCETGGHDGPERGLRFLEWSAAPDSGGTTFRTDYVVALRDAQGAVRVVHDRHTFGLFPRADWLAALGRRFQVRSKLDAWNRDVFIARRPLT